MDESEKLEQIEETMANRKIAKRLANEAASKGHPIAGMLSALEQVAEPFFIGIDEDPDDSDMDVFP